MKNKRYLFLFQKFDFLFVNFIREKYTANVLLSLLGLLLPIMDFFQVTRSLLQVLHKFKMYK